MLVPITMPRELNNYGAALFAMFRIVSCSTGISLATAAITECTQVHQPNLLQWVNPFYQPFQTLIPSYEQALRAMDGAKRNPGTDSRLRSSDPELRFAPSGHLRRPFQLDQATPDFSSSLYVILNICCVSPPHRARHCLGVLDESGEHLQQGFAIVQENVPPHHRVACCDASEIAEPGGSEPQYFLAALCGQIVGGTADGEGDQVREM
jgi:hypothetical protein